MFQMHTKDCFSAKINESKPTNIQILVELSYRRTEKKTSVYLAFLSVSLSFSFHI